VGGDLILNEFIAIGEIIERYFAPNDYLMVYIDDSGDLQSLTLTLNESKMITLNTSYNDVIFSIFDEAGLGVLHGSVRLYINSERRDFGMNWIQGDTCAIKVLDFFNSTLFSQTVNIADLTEYNIFCPIYTLSINNNYTTSMEVQIYRSGTNIAFKQVIPSQVALSYRFLSGIEYEIFMVYLNGTVADTDTVLLDENYKIISFGYYERIAPLVITSGVTINSYVMGIVASVALGIFFSGAWETKTPKILSASKPRYSTKADKKKPKTNNPIRSFINKGR
jgi:hypothetical protein